MDDDLRPRNLPLPTATKAVIPQAEVPEVTLQWDSEGSVYWRPTQPVIVSAHKDIIAGTVSNMQLPILSGLSVASQQNYTAAAPLSTVQTMLPSRISQSCASSNSGTSGVGIKNSSLAAAMLSRQRSTEEFVRIDSQLNYQNNVTSAQNFSRNQSTFDEKTQAWHKDSADVHTSIKLSVNNKGPPMPSWQQHNFPQENNSVSSVPLIQQIPASNEHDNLGCHSPKRYPICSSSPTVFSNYNPSVYNSGRKPLQDQNPVNCYRSNTQNERENTPILNKDRRTIVPRAVNFNDASPLNTQNPVWINNKENFSPENLNLPKSKLTQYNSKGTPTDQGNRGIVHYHPEHQDFPLLQVNSPDPFLCKILDGKDQQIFQLHKVLETLLSQSNTKHQTNNFSSDVQSPKPNLHKIAITQTSFCEDNHVETRSIGVNTDVSWTKLLESVYKSNHEENVNKYIENKPTILKNKTSQNSNLMQKNSNISSVRFEAFTQNVARTDSVKVYDSPCSLCHCHTNSNHCGSNTNLLDTHPCDKELLVDQLQKNMGITNHRRTTAAAHDPAPECYNINRGSSVCSSGGNHREVSLTLREVVLTTIHEDPASPQHSLHLELPEYPEDTIHQGCCAPSLPHSLPPTAAFSVPPCSAPLNAARNTNAVLSERSHSPPRRNYRMDSHGDQQHWNGTEPNTRAECMDRDRNGRNDDCRQYGGSRDCGGPPHQGDDVRNRPATPYARRGWDGDKGRPYRHQCDYRGQKCGTYGSDRKTGVTIYRNVMNNIEQLLEPRVEEMQQRITTSPKTRRQPLQMSALQQQLQQFGLSFIEPRALAHSTQRPPPLPSVNTSAAIGRRIPATSGPEFSVATEEFLRNNGLLHQ